MAFHPYLYFAGNCREAFTRYHEIFGGDLTIMDGSQAPPGAVPPEKMDLVLHAGIQNGDELLMASDSYDDDFQPDPGVSVHYATTDIEKAKSVFAQLSEGGDVTIAAEEQFWTPFYGAVTGRFGIRWQVGVDVPQE